MMIIIPFLMAAVPGVIAILVTRWLKQRQCSLMIRLLPGLFTAGGAVFSLYYGLEISRGFEGAAYGILSFFLISSSVICLVMAAKTASQTNVTK